MLTSERDDLRESKHFEGKVIVLRLVFNRSDSSVSTPDQHGNPERFLFCFWKENCREVYKLLLVSQVRNLRREDPNCRGRTQGALSQKRNFSTAIPIVTDKCAAERQKLDTENQSYNVIPKNRRQLLSRNIFYRPNVLRPVIKTRCLLMSRRTIFTRESPRPLY